MGTCCKLLIVTGTVIAALLGYQVKTLLEVPPLPKIENTWWGSGDPSKEDKTIKPFKINVPDEVLKDLTQRLTNSRKFIPPLEGIQQQYGINTKLLTDIVDYWKAKYNWREREQFLNQYKQFTVSVQGLKIHYLHVKPVTTKGEKVFPLLMLHGWPGSVREFYEIIPLLTKPQKGRGFVYELIIPSLPGYGFSEAAVRPGLGAIQMAVVFKNFMERIGFEKYYIQGGDWGGIIADNMATLFPDKIIGMHNNMCFLSTPLSNLKLLLYSFKPSLIVDEAHEHLVYPMSMIFTKLVSETGYMHLQSTKPDTIGVGLNDSPVGLAAYILEKFTTWTNPQWINLPDGGLTKKFTLTQLLDNVMIYWVTGSITTSIRLYAETFNKKNNVFVQLGNIPTNTPSGCVRNIHDMAYTPNIILENKYTNLLHVADHDGGHFAAFEAPHTLAEDIFLFTEKVLRQQDTKK